MYTQNTNQNIKFECANQIYCYLAQKIENKIVHDYTNLTGLN